MTLQNIVQNHKDATGVARWAAALLLLAAPVLVSPSWAATPAPAPAPAAATPPAPAAAPNPDIVATSGTMQLTGQDVRALVQQAAPNVRAQLEKDPNALAQVVRGDILKKQLLAEALAKKWDQTPAVAAQEQIARDAVVVNTYVASLTQPPADFPNDAAVQSAYDANKQRFLVPRQFHMAQIFKAVPAGAPAATDETTHKKLLALRALLVKPHADFGAAATKQSDDHATAGAGGDVGWLREDKLIPGLQKDVAALPEGGITQPIRAADGWHMLKLLGTRPAAVAPLADVRPNIVAALRQQQQQQNERALIAKMQQQQPIEINEIALGKAVKP